MKPLIRPENTCVFREICASGGTEVSQISRIWGRGSTSSTAGMYDLCTASAQAVDKKSSFLTSGNYPQVPPQAHSPLYRGFRYHKNQINQRVDGVFHEIWPYHHHQAFDLYPDLKAWKGRKHPVPGLWTASCSSADARSFSAQFEPVEASFSADLATLSRARA